VIDVLVQPKKPFAFFFIVVGGLIFWGGELVGALGFVQEMQQ